MAIAADQAIEILRAAGEASRLRILALLACEELAVMELCQILDQSQPRVSRHLKLLAEAGLIERFPDGAWVFYRLTEGGDGSGRGEGGGGQRRQEDRTHRHRGSSSPGRRPRRPPPRLGASPRSGGRASAAIA